jgi:hypothetical protein
MIKTKGKGAAGRKGGSGILKALQAAEMVDTKARLSAGEQDL